MNDIHQSASASAEANGIKVSGNTVNINRAHRKGAADPAGFSGLLRSLAPIWYENREARARKIKTESIIVSANRLKREFPVMSERRALMAALGYPMTNDQADNVARVFNETQEDIATRNLEPKRISSESRDAIIDGAKTAYDETVRTMWSKLITDEVINPGTFSKRLMSILSDMSGGEARLFSKLCGFCMTLSLSENDMNTHYDPIILLSADLNGASYNGGSFSLFQMGNLESLGLVNMQLSRTINVPPAPGFPFKLGNQVVFLASASQENARIRLPVVLTQYGVELSRLCDLGIDEKAWQTLQLLAEKSGVSATRCD